MFLFLRRIYDYSTLSPIYTYPTIHFRKIDMTTKNCGGFIRFPPLVREDDVMVCLLWSKHNLVKTIIIKYELKSMVYSLFQSYRKNRCEVLCMFKHYDTFFRHVTPNSWIYLGKQWHVMFNIHLSVLTYKLCNVLLCRCISVTCFCFDEFQSFLLTFAVPYCDFYMTFEKPFGNLHINVIS